MSEYKLRYPGACQEKVSIETLDQIRERGCEAGRAAETQDTHRLRRLWNEMEFLAFRLNQLQERSVERSSKSAALINPRCKDCGSDTIFDGKLIHYTDCLTG